MPERHPERYGAVLVEKQPVGIYHPDMPKASTIISSLADNIARLRCISDLVKPWWYEVFSIASRGVRDVVAPVEVLLNQANTLPRVATVRIGYLPGTDSPLTKLI